MAEFVRRGKETHEVETTHHYKQDIQGIVPTLQHGLVVFSGLPGVHGP